ncbi:MAG: hypothetical protein LBT24_05895 [Tannerella sp.]|jgi:hypothetical protein|nr:hypothetical protein [Tannerella sp.]
MATMVKDKAVSAQPNIEDMFSYMVKKAGITKKDIFTVSMKNWIMNNMDLLTPTERKQYDHLFAR